VDARPVGFLVPYDLPVELIGQLIDRGIQVRVDGLAVDVFLGEMDGYLCPLVDLFNAQHDVDFVDMIKVSPGPPEFLIYVLVNCVGNVEVMPFDSQMHGTTSF
jgi:hypothetical protein